MQEKKFERKSVPSGEQKKETEDVEDVIEEIEIEIEKSAICDAKFSDKEIAKFLPIIKNIRREDVPEQDKKEWTKILTPHFLGMRLEKLLKQQTENVIGLEDEEDEGIEFRKRGYKWMEKEKKQSLKIWRVIEEESKGLKKFQPIDVIFEQDEIEEIMNKFLSAIKNMDGKELKRIKKEKEDERHKSQHHKVKVKD